ncbi:MAG: DUF3551 domain-containing protein [Pseudolabrys sp.]
MRHFIAGTGLLLVLSFVGVSPAAAQIYPWCSIYSGVFGGAENCGFTTYQQCMANVSGVGGFCQRNPLWVPPNERGRPAKPRRPAN